MKTCLVIDDSRVIRKVARRILEDIGFNVQEAEDGAIGLDMCRKAMPDAVMVDSMMPNLDGIGFMKTLKREAKESLPAMLYCTTENEESHIVAARAAGAGGILLKPFDKETLEGSLQHLGVSPR